MCTGKWECSCVTVGWCDFFREKLRCSVYGSNEMSIYAHRCCWLLLFSITFWRTRKFHAGNICFSPTKNLREKATKNLQKKNNREKFHWFDRKTEWCHNIVMRSVLSLFLLSNEHSIGLGLPAYSAYSIFISTVVMRVHRSTFFLAKIPNK